MAMTAPTGVSYGPSIKPATMNAAGKGGQANPPYLQMRKPLTPPTPGLPQPPAMGQSPMAASKPVVTPMPTAPGDTVARPSNPPMTPAGKKPQAGGQTLGDVYNFMKSDLQNQTKQAKSNAIADASARGVYYGTPLTGSEADIDTQYLRGLGQLDSGMYANEQQNQLARLGIAANLGWQSGMNQPPQPAPLDFSALGALFGSGNSPTAPVPPTAPQAPRPGPVMGQAPNISGYDPNDPLGLKKKKGIQ